MSHHKKPHKPTPPRAILQALLGSLGDHESTDGSRDATETKNTIHKITRNAISQPFHSQLDILLQSSSSSSSSNTGPALETRLPKELAEIIESYTFQSGRVEPARLLDKPFMDAYIRQGSLVAMSCTGTLNGDDDVLALDGDGHLILSVCKDTYQRIGLEASKYSKGRDRHCMIYDLRLPIMRQDKPVFERLRAGLHRLGHMEMMMAFVNTEGKATDVTNTSGLNLVTRRSKVSHTKTRVPTSIASDLERLVTAQANFQSASNGSKKRKRKSEEVQQSGNQLVDFSDAVGRSLLGVAPEEEEEEESSPQSPALAVRWQGFLHPHLVQRVLDAALRSLPSQSVTFSAISAQKLPHSPLSRNVVRSKAEHASNRTKSGGASNGLAVKPIDALKYIRSEFSQSSQYTAQGWLLCTASRPPSTTTTLHDTARSEARVGGSAGSKLDYVLFQHE